MKRLLALALIALAACEPIDTGRTVSPVDGGDSVPVTAARRFVQVVERMEPVIEDTCQKNTKGLDCDFQIVVDSTPGQPPNAFQTRSKSGRPILAFNTALIADVRNADELAFVMGHEGAHHMLNHLDEQRQNAAAGAVILSGIAAVMGADLEQIREAEQLGAAAGALSYSKQHELEADRLGTIITHQAGYNPLRGAEYFNRLPDPKNAFLSTHPSNKARIQIVRQTATELGVR